MSIISKKHRKYSFLVLFLLLSIVYQALIRLLSYDINLKTKGKSFIKYLQIIYIFIGDRTVKYHTFLDKMIL